jgi:hypothetical protein
MKNPGFLVRTVYLLLLPVLLTACLPVKAQAPSDEQMVAMLVDQVDVDAITCSIEHLQDDQASLELDDDGTRFPTTRNASENVKDIVAQFEAYGLETEVDEFTLREELCPELTSAIRNNFECEESLADKIVFQNVVATLKGEDSRQYYLVMAHYDSINPKVEGWAENLETTPAPGANDNGSGVAIMLETARVLSGSEFAYDIRFAALAAEEWGLLGSRRYVDQALENNEHIAGFINLDLVGRSEAEYPHIYVYYKIDAPDSLALAEQIIDVNTTHQIMSAALYAEQNWLDGFSGRSDQVPFWWVGFTSGVFLAVVNDAANITLVDDTYHTASDVLYNPDGSLRLSADQLESMAQLTVASIASLAQPLEVDQAPEPNCPPVSNNIVDRVEDWLQKAQQWLEEEVVRVWPQVQDWLEQLWESLLEILGQ